MMIKKAAIDVDFLVQKIIDSGLKIGHIAARTGLTEKDFTHKLEEERAFTPPEIIALSLTLNLSPNETRQIFIDPEA